MIDLMNITNDWYRECFKIEQLKMECYENVQLLTYLNNIRFQIVSQVSDCYFLVDFVWMY